MTTIDRIQDGAAIFRALDSDVRRSIIRLLSRRGGMNMNDLAEKLGITNGALTAHVRMLCDCGLIEIRTGSGKRGMQKICSLREDRILISLVDQPDAGTLYQTELGVGQFLEHEIFPTCGIATADNLIGEVDDPRYFDDPARTDAGIIWFSKGYVEYRIPNYLKPRQRPHEIQISMEISSEAPGYCEDWPSDIYFSLCGHPLGRWTSPGDYGVTHGAFTPAWWSPAFNQYGLMKLLSIRREGTFMDGIQISGLCIGDLAIDHRSPLTLRISVPTEEPGARGVTLFGRGFGNYNQGITVRVLYDAE